MSDSKTLASIELRLWELNGVVIERYRYSSGFVEPLSKHSHEEYQFGLSFDCQGEYYYRGQLHYIPTGSISVLQSGEVHAPSERLYLASPATFMMMYPSSQFKKEEGRRVKVRYKCIDVPNFNPKL